MGKHAEDFAKTMKLINERDPDQMLDVEALNNVYLGTIAMKMCDIADELHELNEKFGEKNDKLGKV